MNTYNHPRFASLGITMLLQHLRHWHKDAWGKCHVKEMVSLFLTMSNLLKPVMKRFEGLVSTLMPGHVAASIAELLELFCESGAF